MVSELQKTLKFVPNDYCEGLDLLSLEAPKTVDYVVVVTLVSIAVAVLIVTVICLVIRKKIIKKNSDVLEASKKNNNV